MLALACPASVRAEADQKTTEPDLPSAAMLEFLGDLAPVDDETWQLLEHHALKDAAQNQEVNSE